MSVRDLLRENDVRFRALAHGFSADDWLCPSLCERWTNHEVLAHLVVGLSASLHSVVGAMVGHSGSFDSANAEMARTLAAVRSPAELLDDYERLSHQPRGMGRYFPSRLFLGDHVTHELDMVFALDREPEIEPDVLVAVLNTQVAVPNPFVPAFRNSRACGCGRPTPSGATASGDHWSKAAPPNSCRCSATDRSRCHASSATASPCSSRGSASGPVRPGEDLHVVARGVLEVDAAAAVVVVDLARSGSPWSAQWSRPRSRILP